MNNNSNKIFVIGATGYIGAKLLQDAKHAWETYGTSTAGGVDLLSFRLDKYTYFNYDIINEGDTIYMTAAISSPDVCSNHYDRANTVNVTGTSYFISKALERGARVVFFSSDTVYGEQFNVFDEASFCYPAGRYAIMKHTVEKRFLGNPLFKTLRLSYVFSRHDKLSHYLSSCTERHEEAELFHPFYRSIVYRDDVIEGALALASCWEDVPDQIINFGGPEVLSRVEFAECLRKAYIHDLRYTVTEPDAAFFENRPRVIAMMSPIFATLLGRIPYTICEAACLELRSTINSKELI